MVFMIAAEVSSVTKTNRNGCEMNFSAAKVLTCAEDLNLESPDAEESVQVNHIYITAALN